MPWCRSSHLVSLIEWGIIESYRVKVHDEYEVTCSYDWDFLRSLIEEVCLICYFLDEFALIEIGIVWLLVVIVADKLEYTQHVVLNDTFRLHSVTASLCRALPNFYAVFLIIYTHLPIRMVPVSLPSRNTISSLFNISYKKDKRLKLTEVFRLVSWE